MAKNVGASKKVVKEGGMMFLNEIREGTRGPITIMVCRKWDVNNIRGRCISTDFVVSDEKGNVIHCTAKSNISHRFINKLEEGCVYTMQDFVVHPSKEAYRVIQDASYIIELDGDTGFRKSTVTTGGFVRYPLQLVDFEALNPAEKTRLSDVVGCMSSVSEPGITSTGAKTLEFNLVNHRGKQVRVTLWGKLCDELLCRMGKKSEVYFIVLTAMIAKLYNGQLSVSSSSATIIFDSEDIPALKEFKCEYSEVDLKDCIEAIKAPAARWGTIADILDWGRTNGKDNNATFMCKVDIIYVRTKHSWYNLTCTNGKCRKGCECIDGKFHCPGCATDVAYPRVRFRVQLDVKDETGEIVIVCFDETAEKLAKTTASELLDQQSGDTFDDSVLPKCLASLVGTTQVFEIRSATYHQYGDYESFNCNKVLSPEHLDEKVAGDSPNNQVGSSKVVSSIATPAKPRETNMRKNVVYEDSEEEDGPVDGSANISIDVHAKNIRKNVVFEDREPADGLSETSANCSGDNRANKKLRCGDKHGAKLISANQEQHPDAGNLG